MLMTGEIRATETGLRCWREGGRSAAAKRRSHICNGPHAASLFAIGLGLCGGPVAPAKAGVDRVREAGVEAAQRDLGRVLHKPIANVKLGCAA